MSENEYLLPLTEREREDLIFASSALGREMIGFPQTAERFDTLIAKLRALEPIGTGGTTEGA